MLHRQITECWVWDDDEPYTKGQAWIYLLLCANHSDAKIYLDGKLEIVKRGQYVTSIRKLAEKFSWSRDKVSKFLKLLEQDNMIIQNSDTKKTLLTIVNYGKYQATPNEKQTADGQQTDSRRTALMPPNCHHLCHRPTQTIMIIIITMIIMIIIILTPLNPPKGNGITYDTRTLKTQCTF